MTFTFYTYNQHLFKTMKPFFGEHSLSNECPLCPQVSTHDDPHDSKTSGISKLSLHLQETNRANHIINYCYEMSSVRTKLPTHSMRLSN